MPEIVIGVLLLDDAGFGKITRNGASALFRVVCARYRQRSTIVVTNFPLENGLRRLSTQEFYSRTYRAAIGSGMSRRAMAALGTGDAVQRLAHSCYRNDVAHCYFGAARGNCRSRRARRCGADEFARI